MSARAPSRQRRRANWGRRSLKLCDLPQAADRLWTRLYIREVDDYLEKFHGFRPGGYHPIHLRDELNDGQYRVVHKLGHGGYAAVWLCRDLHVDTSSYVAVKVIIADNHGGDNMELILASDAKQKCVEVSIREHLCLPLKQFTSHSPSGIHSCLVYPVLGPSIQNAATIIDEEENLIGILQELSRQVVVALCALHSRGICHGDFRPSNILLEMRSLDGLDKEEVLSLLGEPQTAQVHIREDTHPTPDIPYAPKTLVYAPDVEDIDPELILPRIKVIDFGQSFDVSQEPLPVTFGIPANYAAPEIVLEI